MIQNSPVTVRNLAISLAVIGMAAKPLYMFFSRVCQSPAIRSLRSYQFIAFKSLKIKKNLQKNVKCFLDRIINQLFMFRMGKPSGIDLIFEGMESSSKDFYKKFASFALKSGKESEEVKLFLFHYLQKAANWHSQRAKKLKRPLPFEPIMHAKGENSNIEELTTYNRECTGFLYAQLVTAIQKELSIKVEATLSLNLNKEIYPIYHLSFKESLKLYCNLIEPNNFEEIKQLISVVFDEVKLNITEPKILILIDNLVDKEQSLSARFQQMTDLHKQILKEITDFHQDENDQHRAKQLKDQVFLRVGVIGFDCIGGQPVLIFPKVIPAGREIRTFLQKRIVKSGYAPTMLQARKTIINLSNKFGDLIGVEPEPSFAVEEKQFSSLDAFFNVPEVQRYLELGRSFEKEDKSEPNAKNLFYSAYSKLFEGLRNSNLDSLLGNPDSGPVINSSLNRVLYCMKVCNQKRNQDAKFFFYHELLSEELLLLLNLTQPYSKGCFEAIFLKSRKQAIDILDAKTKKKHPSIDQIQPRVMSFASGMSCVDAILRGMHRVTPNLTIACSSESYYETVSSMSEVNSHSNVKEKKLTYLEMNSKNLAEVAAQQPDLVYLDFRTSGSLTATEYTIQDVRKIVDTLLASRKSCLTLAIDVTLDKLRSKEIENFVKSYEDKIKKGELNLFLYRSAQKFDLVNSDKINAGHMMFYTEDGALRKIFEDLEGQLTGLDYQVLCHFHAYASYEIHQYLKLHYKNTHKVYEKVVELANDKSSFIQVTPKMDKKLFFIELSSSRVAKMIQNKKKSLALNYYPESFRNYLVNEAFSFGVPLNPRDSFGFTETTICKLGDAKTRLSVGILNPSEIEKLAKVILSIKKAEFKSKMLDLGCEIERLMNENLE